MENINIETTGMKTTSQIQEMADREHPGANRVFGVEPPRQLPDSQVKSMTSVQELMDRALSAAAAARASDATVPDATVVAMLAGDDPVLANFADTHPQLFKMVTAADFDNAKLDMIVKMMDMKRSHQRRQLNVHEQHSEVQTFVQENLMHAPK